MQVEKIKTGIDKLDEILDGGVPKKHLVLITGTTGTMKSTLGFQILYQSALNGMNAAYISLEQSAMSVMTQMSIMGYDFSKITIDSNDSNVINNFSASRKDKKKGMLSIIDVGYMRKKSGKQKKFSWLNAIKSKLSEMSKKRADVIVLDSLNALYHLDKFEDMRVDLFYLFEYLKDLKLTSFIINEMPAGDERYSQYGIESYLVDGVIQLALAKRELKVKREMNIVKMRYVDHMTNIFVFRYDKKQKRFDISEKIAVE
ncbi:MAG: ATPase domain-containing protein [Nanoarchaeota archaeon]|nr:ATPase domain-containing protein [Nanoarchaeota archaeon]